MLSSEVGEKIGTIAITLVLTHKTGKSIRDKIVTLTLIIGSLFFSDIQEIMNFELTETSLGKDRIATYTPIIFLIIL